MQLLCRTGLENGTHEGLGWIDGVVDALPKNANEKIPHMGWNQLTVAEPRHPVLEGIDSGSYVYFVHGYHLVVKSPEHIQATTDHGQFVTAMVARDNIVGTQFHPEKSQAPGLRLIGNFLAWRP